MSNLLGFKKVSELLDVKEGTLRGWVFYKQIPYVKVGRLVKFEPEAIQRFIEKNRVERAS